jgi:hypothetical protein
VVDASAAQRHIPVTHAAASGLAVPLRLRHGVRRAAARAHTIAVR